MYCENCGTEVPEGHSFCPACGTITQSEQSNEQDQTTLKEFIKFPENKDLVRNIWGSAICCYILAVIAFIVGLDDYPQMFIGTAILLVCGILINTIYSRIAAIIILTCSIILMFIMVDEVESWTLLLLGIYTTNSTLKVHTRFDKYMLQESQEKTN